MPYGANLIQKTSNWNRRFGLSNSYFQSTWKTDNINDGSSADNQVTLPLESTGTYNMTVDWGDNSSSVITVWNQVETTHTYSVSGTYTIKIHGTCIGFRFASFGDKLKILDIQKWGNKFQLGNSNRYFDGCANLVISTTDTLKNPSMTDASYFFMNCTSLNSNLNWLNTENIENMVNFLANCSIFNINVNNLNTSKVTNMNGMFANDIVFNQSVSNFDTSLVTDMAYMFISNYKFNQSVSNFDTSNVTSMDSMFYYAAEFNQDISSWNIEQVTNMTNMLYLAYSWSRTNYDLALISWASQSVQDSVSFRCMAQYTLGGAAETARTHLVNDHGWNIQDGGGV